VAHCRSEREAKALLAAIEGRLKKCKLEMHPEKSGVVYCKDGNRRKEYPRIQFTFLGYTFRPRRAKARNGKAWTSFLPAVSAAATQRMYRRIREWHLPRQTSASLNELAKRYDAPLRGWMNYYGRFYRSALGRVFDCFDQSLLRWARRKYRKLARSPRRARRWLQKMVNRQPRLFIHWLAFGGDTNEYRRKRVFGAALEDGGRQGRALRSNSRLALRGRASRRRPQTASVLLHPKGVVVSDRGKGAFKVSGVCREDERKRTVR